MAISIKRENFKGKYYIVVRDKGRFAARRRWNQKFTKRKARGIFNKNKTLNKDIRKRIMSKRDIQTGKPFTEITDERKKPQKPPKILPFRITLRITINGKTIKGSSRAMVWRSVSDAEDQAMENLLAVLSFHLFGETDTNEADEFLKGKKHMIKRELIVIK